MYIVCDENIPPKIPDAIKLLDMTAQYYEVHTIRELGLLSTKDIDLFAELKNRATAKHKKCVFITGDVNIFKRKPELQAFKNNKIIAFVCPPSYGNKPLWERSVYMMSCWSAIIEVAQKAHEKDIFILPAYSGMLNSKRIRKK